MGDNRGMSDSPPSPGTGNTIAILIRFADFEARAETGELRRGGVAVQIRPQAFKVLVLLASRPGELVTRDEIRKDLWGDSTFVDFEHGVNFCINQLRSALGDDAESPRFIETLPRRGYRFIAPIREQPALEAPSPAQASNRRWASAVLGAAGMALLLALSPYALREQPSATPRVRLIVLPFEDLSASREGEYFATGLTEALTSELGRLAPERLGVIARSTALAYRGKTTTDAALERELRADFLIEGSLRLSGDRVLVSATLVTVRDRTQLWTQTYDREVQDVTEVQGATARGVARAIRLILPEATQARLSASSAVKPEAYRLYLQARYFLDSRREQDVRRAIATFESSVALDPRFAPAYVGLAKSHAVLVSHAMGAPGEDESNAKRAAARALELAPDLAEAHAADALVRDVFGWDLAGAEASARRAIELNPSYADARNHYCLLLVMQGHYHHAVEEARKALDLDPLSSVINYNYAVALLATRDPAGALKQARRTIELNDAFPAGYYALARAQIALDRLPEALETLRRASEANPESVLLLGTLGSAQARAGQVEEARATLARLAALGERDRGVMFERAIVLAGLGDREGAVASLEQAWRAREPGLRWAGVVSELDSVRADPRVQSILKEAGLAGHS